MSAQNASIQEGYIALPLRQHTILGVCEGIGEDFGFNPIFLRVPLAAVVLWNPLIAIGTYFLLGALVFASRLLFPRSKSSSDRQIATHDNDCDRSEQLQVAA